MVTYLLSTLAEEQRVERSHYQETKEGSKGMKSSDAFDHPDLPEKKSLPAVATK
jgi:hypothetical protein